MTHYLMSEDGARFLMGCFAVLSALTFLAGGPGDKMRAREIHASRR